MCGLPPRIPLLQAAGAHLYAGSLSPLQVEGVRYPHGARGVNLGWSVCHGVPAGRVPQDYPETSSKAALGSAAQWALQSTGWAEAAGEEELLHYWF